MLSAATTIVPDAKSWIARFLFEKIIEKKEIKPSDILTTILTYAWTNDILSRFGTVLTLILMSFWPRVQSLLVQKGS